MNKLIVKVDCGEHLCGKCEHIRPYMPECALFKEELGDVEGKPHRCKKCMRAGYLAQVESTKRDLSHERDNQKLFAAFLFAETIAGKFALSIENAGNTRAVTPNGAIDIAHAAIVCTEMFLETWDEYIDSKAHEKCQP